MDPTVDKHCICPEGTFGMQCEFDSRFPACTGCQPGYELRDGRCVDIDECYNRRGGCDPMRQCVNTPGSFHCGECYGGMQWLDGICRYPCVDRDAILKLPADTTFVTALQFTGRSDRKFDYYLEKLYKLLNVPIPLVVYAPQHVIDWAMDMRKNHTQPATRTKPFIGIPYSRDMITNSEEYKYTDRIRQSPQWNQVCNWCAGNPNGQRLYNEITLWKSRWVAGVAEKNPFNTSTFLWVDAGWTCTPTEDFESLQRWVPTLGDNVIIGQHFHYAGNAEVHGFARGPMAQYSRTDFVEWVVRGGIWGGSRKTVILFNKIHQELLMRSLKQDLLGTEESLFSIMRYVRPDLFRLRREDPCLPMTPCVAKGTGASPLPDHPAPYFVEGIPKP